MGFRKLPLPKGETGGGPHPAIEAGWVRSHPGRRPIALRARAAAALAFSYRGCAALKAAGLCPATRKLFEKSLTKNF